MKRISPAWLLIPFAAAAALAAELPPERSTLEAIAQAHTVLWKTFVDRHGVILDFIGEIPTPEECSLGKPNALGWYTPIENGPMFGGLYLPAACERARRSGFAADRAEARRLAQGLIACASVSDVPGMVVRGLSTDGTSHFPLGSDDQTHPWFYGLHAYWKSGIPDEAERARIAAKVKQVAEALEQCRWLCPCDGSFKGQYRGGFRGDAHRDATRYLFMLKAVHEITGDGVWLERYRAALAERPGKKGLTRVEICAAGMEADVAAAKWERKSGAFWCWIFVGAQASLKYLCGVETNAERREQFRAGLKLNAASVVDELAASANFDNHDTKEFGKSNWRAIYTNWEPQKSAADAERLAKGGDRRKVGLRSNYETQYVNTPLAAAAIVALAGDPSNRAPIEAAIRHYDYGKLFSSRFFFAECAYYALSEK